MVGGRVLWLKASDVEALIAPTDECCGWSPPKSTIGSRMRSSSSQRGSRWSPSGTDCLVARLCRKAAADLSFRDGQSGAGTAGPESGRFPLVLI